MATPDANPSPEAQPNHPNYSAAAIAHIQAAIANLGATLQSVPNILQQLITLALNFLAGIGGKINYKLPTEQFSTTFSALGKTWTFTAAVENGHLKISLTPSS